VYVGVQAELLVEVCVREAVGDFKGGLSTQWRTKVSITLDSEMLRDQHKALK